jgi:hypothetical protein
MMNIVFKRYILAFSYLFIGICAGFAQAVVTSVAPSVGPVVGGTNIIISGSNFLTPNSVTSVNIGTMAVSSFTIATNNYISAFTSANVAGTAHVLLTTNTGIVSTATSADLFSYDTTPVFVNPALTVNVTQNVAYTTLNTQLAVSDVDSGQTETFTQQTAPSHGIITFLTSTGGAATNATANSGGMSITTNGVIKYTPTTSYTGNDSFVIQVSDGISTANQTVNVGVYALPSINAVSPNYGPAVGGTIVSITGNNLSTATAVTFNTVNAVSFTINTNNLITAVAPSGNAGPAIDIAVVNPGGVTTAATSDKFTYYNTPVVSGLSAANGTLVGGAIVTITGNYFTNAGTTTVNFGATPATSITVNSATQITATVPTLTSGNVDVVVSTLGGASATSSADQYTAYDIPSIASISTNSGVMAGGTAVVITGTNLTGVSTVNFGTVSAASFTVNSATQITTTAPAGAQATVDIVVKSPGGYSATSSADQFSYYASPIISWSNPADIIYPTALSAIQLSANATYNGAAVSGNYVYTPVSGTILSAGTQTLNVVFTPTNSALFATVNTYVKLNVDSSPTITTQPQSNTVMAGSTANVSVVATGFPPPSYQWYFNGAPIAGATSATLTTNNVQAANAGNYTVFVSNNVNSALSSVATLTVTYPASAPVFSVSPSSSALTVGTSTTLTATATGNPTPTYQWYFNGVAITGATGSTLSIANAQAGNSGSYTVVATNSSGSVTSNAAFVTANPATGAPTFSLQPASQVVTASSTVVFRAATATTGATYQWYLNGIAISGATKASFSTTAVPANYGNYQCMVVTATGAVLSQIATISPVTTSNPGRLVNLSVLTLDAPGSQLLTLGFVSGGSGTTGTQPVLVRGIGPALTAYNVAGVLPDPKISLFNGSTLVNSNSGWGSSITNITQVNAADAATGAFTLTNTASLDSALVATLPSAAYTVQVSSPTSSTGNALAEVYDNTATGTYTATTPRLINLSCLQLVKANSLLTAGFTVSGMTAKTVLIRASGPSLSAFNVSGVMPDPTLNLFSGTTSIATNAGWGGDAAIAAANSSVYAFAFASAASKDSALLVTLNPGTYSVQVTSATGAAGTTLVEVYEVP